MPSPSSSKRFCGHPLFDTAERLGDMSDEATYDSLHQFLNQNPTVVKEHYTAALEFLYRYQAIKGTFTSFRGEVQRFLLFVWVLRSRDLGSIDEDLVADYLNFIKKPYAAWIARGNHPAFIDVQGGRKANPKWRPFVQRKDGAYQIATSSLAAGWSALNSFFQFLVRRKIVPSNPLVDLPKHHRIGHQNSKKPSGKERRLSDEEWAYVLEFALGETENNPSAERDLFILVTLKALMLRVSELAPWTDLRGNGRIPVFGHFKMEKEQGEWVWVLEVFGKGAKFRSVSVPEQYLPFLKRYREYRGLPPLPLENEQIPLIVGRSGEALGVRQISRLLSNTLLRAADHMEADGDPNGASRLRASATSTHFMRHLGASQALEGASPEMLRFISQELGHKTPAFTDRIYIGSDISRQRLAGKKRRV